MSKLWTTPPMWVNTPACFPYWISSQEQKTYQVFDRPLGCQLLSAPPGTDVQQAIDGVQLSYFTGLNVCINLVSNPISQYLEEADNSAVVVAPHMYGEDATNGVYNPSHYLELLSQYEAASSNHTSAARSSDGRLVVFLGETYLMTVAQWQEVIKAVGRKFAFVANLEGGMSITTWANSEAKTGEYMIFDCHYCFQGAAFGKYWSEFKALAKSKGVEVLGTVSPGYNREWEQVNGAWKPNPTGGYNDAKGTSTLRASYEQALSDLGSNSTVGVFGTTWDDFSEYTHMCPSADRGHALADLCTLYNERISGTTLFLEASIYTVPQVNGQSVEDVLVNEDGSLTVSAPASEPLLPNYNWVGMQAPERTLYFSGVEGELVPGPTVKRDGDVLTVTSVDTEGENVIDIWEDGVRTHTIWGTLPTEGTYKYVVNVSCPKGKGRILVREVSWSTFVGYTLA